MKSHLRNIGLIAAFLIGGIYYEPLSQLAAIIPYSVGLILFLSFVGISASQLIPERMHIKLLVAQHISTLVFVATPALLGYYDIAEGIYYCAGAPVAAAAPAVLTMLRGKVAFITTALILSHICFIIVAPLVLPLLAQDSHLSYSELLKHVLRNVSLLLLLPAILAIAIRKVYPASQQWTRKGANLILIIWIINICIISAMGVQRIIKSDTSWHDMIPLVICAAIVCLANFCIGYKLGKPNYAREFSQGMGQKNTILTLYLAGQPYSSPIAYIAPAFYVLFHNLANSIQLHLAQRQQERDAREAAAASKKMV